MPRIFKTVIMCLALFRFISCNTCGISWAEDAHFSPLISESGLQRFDVHALRPIASRMRSKSEADYFYIEPEMLRSKTSGHGADLEIISDESFSVGYSAAYSPLSRADSIFQDMLIIYEKIESIVGSILRPESSSLVSVMISHLIENSLDSIMLKIDKYGSDSVPDMPIRFQVLYNKVDNIFSFVLSDYGGGIPLEMLKLWESDNFVSSKNPFSASTYGGIGEGIRWMLLKAIKQGWQVEIISKQAVSGKDTTYKFLQQASGKKSVREYHNIGGPAVFMIISNVKDIMQNQQGFGTIGSGRHPRTDSEPQKSTWHEKYNNLLSASA